MKDNYFNSQTLSFFIWFPFIFCLILAAIDVFFLSSHAQAYVAMANPFIFVSCLFVVFRLEIKRQNEKITELEEKLKELD